MVPGNVVGETFARDDGLVVWAVRRDAFVGCLPVPSPSSDSTLSVLRFETGNAASAVYAS